VQLPQGWWVFHAFSSENSGPMRYFFENFIITSIVLTCVALPTSGWMSGVGKGRYFEPHLTGSVEELKVMEFKITWVDQKGPHDSI
jgi:hypothetical protein